ncbi:DUF5130 family protein [Pseudonocardia acaciae]|uniref:DUF5130 family protein n=1 Tax=Pseudonocardia acaciae TaxID=551276 RepID=UPI000A0137B8|nr:DUF5130 family protein [Pseudonocardia acaciae]
MAAGELAQTTETEVAHGAPAGTDAAHGAHGHEVRKAEPEDLPLGSVVTNSGRVSAATEFNIDEPAVSPFSAVQLTRLDEALTLVSRHTQLRFSIYLGDLGDDSHAGALALHDQLGPAGADSVLIAADPNRHNVDIVTGSVARVRLADRACKLAVMSMIASFKEGDLLGGLLSGLRMLSDQAGTPHH